MVICRDCRRRYPVDSILPVRCPCGNVIGSPVLVAEVVAEDRAKNLTQLAEVLPQAVPPWIQERLDICRECEEYRKTKHGSEYCDFLARASKGATLMGPKGIPNPKAKCPLPKPEWVEIADEH